MAPMVSTKLPSWLVVVARLAGLRRCPASLYRNSPVHAREKVQRKWCRSDQLRKNGKQILQVRSLRGIAQKRRDSKDFFEAAQQRPVSIVHGTGVALPFRKRRENDHADRAIGRIGFIPGNKDCSAIAIGLGIQNLRQIFRQPVVALRDLVVSRSPAVMHVIPDVGSDEVVSRDGITRHIPGQLIVRTNVRDTVGGTSILLAGYVIKINKRIVTHGIRIFIGKRAVFSRNVFLVGAPSNTSIGCVIEQRYQMLRAGLAIRLWRAVVEYPEIRARLDPKIVGQAGMHVGRVEVLLRMRRYG